MNRPAVPPSSADRQRLALLIEAEAIQLGEFVELLAREEALLIAGDVDALVALCQDKNDRYRRLQRLSDDRSLLLGRFGQAVTDAVIRDWLAGLPRVLARSLLKIWSKLSGRPFASTPFTERVAQK